MSCKQTLREFFLKCDIFSTSEFLRYDSEPEYRTYTGALCSLITVISFCGIFMNVMISTFAKTDIIWSLNTVQESVDSFSVTTDTRGSQKFMFAAALSGIDFRDKTQSFNVSLILRKKQNSISSANQYIQLQECTKTHWAVNDEMIQTFDRMNFSTMLCPPIGLNIPIQGKFTSEVFQYAEIRIVSCDSNSSKICLDPTTNPNKTYYFNLYILNTLINPHQSDYITYYLEDRNYIQFSTTFTSLINIFVSNYQITTDESIWPIPSARQEVGAVISNLGQVVPHPTDGVVFASIVLRRSSTAVIVERSFKRIDDTLSYIGGLFGFVVILLLFMKEYTEYSFELDASSHLYHIQPDSTAPEFNFIIFIGYIFYLLISAIGFTPDWKSMKAIDDSREQIQKQFDVRFLFQRVNFLQKSLGMLFNEDQSKLLHLHRRPTLKEASELRQNYLFKKMISSQNPNQQTESPLDNTTENFTLPFGQRNKVSPQQDSPLSLVQKMKSGIKLLQKKSFKGDNLSKKIIQDLDPNIVKIIFQDNRQESIKEEKISSSIEKLEKSEREKSSNNNHAQIIDLENNKEIQQLMPPFSQRKRKSSLQANFDFVN